MFIGGIVVVLLSLLHSVLNQNNYILDKPCTLNSDNNLWECFLSYNETKTPQNNEGINTSIFPNSNGEKKLLPNSKIIKKLKFEARNLENDVTHIKIYDAEKKRYEIPRNSIEYFEKMRGNITFQKKNLKCLNDLKTGESFSIDYLNDSGDEILFRFLSDFIFLDDYLGFSYLFNTNQIFGYGERSSDFKLKAGIYSTWPRDIANKFDDGKGARNSYGHQPFFLNRNHKSSFTGIAFLNSNAQDLEIKEKNQDGKTLVKQISIGGIIELLFIHATNPQELLQKYHNIIGKPVLPNFWALGWHQSRWGYNSTSALKNVIQKYNENKIPIDTIWSDIDYMKNYEDFGYDEENYKGLPEFVEDIKKSGIHYVPIIDMGIPFIKENYFYNLGKEYEIFIKSNYTNDDLLNEVWPGVCVFPDFTNYQNAKSFWHIGLKSLNTLLNYDGIWLDMNEPAGFIPGEIAEKKTAENNQYFNLTYMPGLFREDYDIEKSSLSLNAIMSNEYAPFNTMFNLKPLNVFYQNKITNEYFLSKETRPFILSRSNFIGMGRYSNHWLGDNMSFWNNMTASIAGIFNFQMFGFNLVGADICGLIYDTDDDMCARWTALGAFYPFSRNHNNFSSIDQEPYNLGNY